MKKTGSRKSYHWSESEIRQLIALYESGSSMEATGERFGISKQRVEQIFRKAGIKKRKYTKSEKYIAARKNKRKIMPKKQLIEFYIDKKLPINEIIKKLKTNSEVFYRSLDFHNIPKRTNERIEYSPLTRQLLHSLYIEEDLTSTEIARRLGYATITIRRRLSMLGIRKIDRNKNEQLQ